MDSHTSHTASGLMESKSHIASSPVNNTQVLRIGYFDSSETSDQRPGQAMQLRAHGPDDQAEIAVYESDETRPSYRKMFLSRLNGAGCSGCDGDDSKTPTKSPSWRGWNIPVRNDADWALDWQPAGGSRMRFNR